MQHIESERITDITRNHPCKTKAFDFIGGRYNTPHARPSTTLTRASVEQRIILFSVQMQWVKKHMLIHSQWFEMCARWKAQCEAMAKFIVLLVVTSMVNVFVDFMVSLTGKFKVNFMVGSLVELW